MVAVVVYSAGERVYDAVYITNKEPNTVVAELKEFAAENGRGQVYIKERNWTKGTKQWLISFDPWEPTDDQLAKSYTFNKDVRLFAVVSEQQK